MCTMQIKGHKYLLNFDVLLSLFSVAQSNMSISSLQVMYT